MIARACIGWNALSQNQNRDGDTIRRTQESGPLLIPRRLHQLSVTVDSRTLNNAGGDSPRAFVLPEFFAPCLAHFAASFFPPLLRCVPFRISPPSFPSRKTRCPLSLWRPTQGRSAEQRRSPLPPSSSFAHRSRVSSTNDPISVTDSLETK